MHYLIDNSTVGTIVGDQISAWECYIATLKAIIPYIEYEMGQTSQTTKRRAVQQLEVNLVLISKLDNRDGKNPRPEPKGQLHEVPLTQD